MQGTLNASVVQKHVHEMFLSYSSDNILEMLKVKETSIEITVLYEHIKFTAVLTSSNIKIKLEHTVSNGTFGIINNSLKKLQDRIFNFEGGMFEGVYEYDHDTQTYKTIEQEESTEEVEAIAQVDKVEDTKVPDVIERFRNTKSKPIIVNDETGEVMNAVVEEEQQVVEVTEAPKQDALDVFMEEINAEPVQELPTVTLDEFEPIEQVSLFDEEPTVQPIVTEPVEEPVVIEEPKPVQETMTEPQPTTEEAVWDDVW